MVQFTNIKNIFAPSGRCQ